MGEIAKLTVTELLSKDSYKIPLYQRNYAWGYKEISRLLQDIEYAEGIYYLGTMVVANSHGVEYEVIDGQQRHTTLTLINAVLNSKNEKLAVKNSNLFFEIRDESKRVIEELNKGGKSYDTIIKTQTVDSEAGNIIEAVKIIESYFLDRDYKDKTVDYNIRLSNFAHKFYKSITIFRAQLPVDTDVNHYFEIMNTRGEQLEQHEILKAAFMEKLDSKVRRQRFAEMWDACSDMDGYVQKKFKPESRKALFGETFADYPAETVINNFLIFNNEEKNNNVKENSNEENAILNNLQVPVDKDSLTGILDNYTPPKDFDQNKIDTTGTKFTSIIDFPNFLLQVLKLLKVEVTLDDKNLLRDFGYPNSIKIKSERFIIFLLQIRYLFDKFVVKREWIDDEYNWSLKKIENDNYSGTFGDKEDQVKLVMIESMWHVTTPQDTYKTWLQNFLKFLKENIALKDEAEFGKTLLTELKNQANAFFSWKEEHSGLHTPRYVFYFLEYALWQEYYDKVKSTEKEDESWPKYLKKIAGLKHKFYNFSFVQRNSIEHLYPQSRVKELIPRQQFDIDNQVIIDKLGNLCLISRSSNSFFSDDLPEQKRVNSKNKNLNESLKQAIMFESFTGTTWDSKEIEDHHKEMINLLNSFYKS